MHPESIMHIVVWIFFILFGAGACQSTPAAPSSPPAERAPSEKDESESSADQILGNAQKQRDVVQTVSATIAVERIEPLFNKREVRTGSLLYERTDAGPPRFSGMLDKRLIGRRLESRTKHVVYDGRWLSEIDHEKKQCIRWELCGPDADPTRLDGRFPLPIGQPRDEVKRRFVAEVIEGEPESTFLTPVTEGHEVVGLRLTPRPGTPSADDFERIDVWYDTANWIPLGVETIDRKSNIRRVRLRDVQINPELDAQQRAMLQGEVPSEDDWTIDQRPCAPDPGPTP